MFELEKELRKIFTIPNIISFVRIILIIPFVLFYNEKEYIYAGIVLVVSGVSDMFDGMIARKFNQITDLGKVLDPIADKLTLIFVIVCLGSTAPQIIPLIAVLLVKEILMLIGGAVLVKRKIKPPAAKWYGKVATVIFYTSMVVIVLLEIFDVTGFNFHLAITICMIITISSMLFAIINYGRIYFELINKQKTEKINDKKCENHNSKKEIN